MDANQDGVIDRQAWNMSCIMILCLFLMHDVFQEWEKTMSVFEKEALERQAESESARQRALDEIQVHRQQAESAKLHMDQALHQCMDEHSAHTKGFAAMPPIPPQTCQQAQAHSLKAAVAIPKLDFTGLSNTPGRAAKTCPSPAGSKGIPRASSHHGISPQEFAPAPQITPRLHHSATTTITPRGNQPQVQQQPQHHVLMVHGNPHVIPPHGGYVTSPALMQASARDMLPHQCHVGQRTPIQAIAYSMTPRGFPTPRHAVSEEPVTTIKMASSPPLTAPIPTEEDVARMSAAVVKVGNSTMRSRNLEGMSLSSFLSDTPFHEFGEWLVNEKRCVFRVEHAQEMPQGGFYGMQGSRLTPRLSCTEHLSPLPSGVVPKLDLAELHRACRTFLHWWSEKQAIIRYAVQQESNTVEYDAQAMARERHAMEQASVASAIAMSMPAHHREALDQQEAAKKYAEEEAMRHEEARRHEEAEKAAAAQTVAQAEREAREVASLVATVVQREHEAARSASTNRPLIHSMSKSKSMSKSPPRVETPPVPRVAAICTQNIEKLSSDMKEVQAAEKPKVEKKELEGIVTKEEVQIIRKTQEIKEVQVALEKEIMALEEKRLAQKREDALKLQELHRTPDSVVRLSQLKAMLKEGQTVDMQEFLEAARSGQNLPRSPQVQEQASAYRNREHIYLPSVKPLTAFSHSEEAPPRPNTYPATSTLHDMPQVPTQQIKLDWVGKVPSSFDGHHQMNYKNDFATPMERYRTAISSRKEKKSSSSIASDTGEKSANHSVENMRSVSPPVESA